MQPRRVIGALLIAGGLLLAGCGTPAASGRVAHTVKSTPPSTSSPATTAPASAAQQLPGYLATPQGDAIFIEYTRSGGHLTGTVEVAYLEPSGAQVHTSSGAISGTISGSDITISDDSGVLSQSGSLSGTFQGSGLVISFPQSNGQLSPVRFDAASVADYNKAVASLQSSAVHTAALQQEAQAAQQTQQAAAQALANKQQAVDQAANAVENDAGSISTDASNLSTDEGNLQSDVATIKGDLGTVQGDLAQVRADAKSDPLSTCGDAGSTAGDFGSMQGDQGSYQGDLGSNQSDVTSLQNDVATLKSDSAALRDAASQLPGYQPSGGLLGPSYEKAALAAASKALTQYNQAVASDTATINGYLLQAKGVVATANQVCSSVGG